MKSLNILIATLAVSSLCVPAYVAAGSVNNNYYLTSNDDGEDSRKIILRPRGKGQRPNAPIRNLIECWIENNGLTLVVPENIEYIKLELEHEGKIIYSSELSHGCSFVELEPLEGEYYLKVTDNNGIEYEGYFVI